MATKRRANWFTTLLTVDDTVLQEQFSLLAEPAAEAHGQEKKRRGLLSRQSPNSKESEKPKESAQSKETAKNDRITGDLDATKGKLDEIFTLPNNKDIVARPFTVGTRHPWRAYAVFVDGLADKTVINNHILQPLMLLSQVLEEEPVNGRIEVVMKTLLPGNQVEATSTWSEAVPGILSGSTVLFIEQCDGALIVETKGWEHRTVGLAQTEAVVRGPHDAFTESFRANTGLVRAQLRSEHLITEMFKVGILGSTDVAVMYIKGLTNDALVSEVKRRIQDVNVDYLADSGILEQFLADQPWSLVPQTLSTERPDRIAHMLTEGHVAVFVGNSPFVLAMPVVFWTMMQTPEDAYLKFPFGSFLRLIRWGALAVALLLPALYVAVTNYHSEMLPTDLMLSIASSRELVPFPVIIEILLMEFSIELIREAGIRVPSVIGPTIGIVGALIIGQAAVQAGVVSPMLVIVVATTALASFAIPTYNLNFAVRVARFGFLAAAALFGFYGISLGLCALVANLAVQRSFGVPLLAPVAPVVDTSPDVLMRGPEYAMNQRPGYLRTQKRWRQQPYTRMWNSGTRAKRRLWGRRRDES